MASALVERAFDCSGGLLCGPALPRLCSGGDRRRATNRFAVDSIFLKNHEMIFKLRFLARLQFFWRFSRPRSYTARYVHRSEVGSGGGGGAWLLGDGAIAAILTEL